MAMSTRRINPTSMRNLQAYIRDLPVHVRKRGDPAIKAGADMYAEALKKAIIDQTYASSYDALNEDYVLRKIRKGVVSDYPAFWQFDQSLMNAISVERRSTAGKSGNGNMSYVVGFNSEQHHSGFTNATLAQMLEYGYGVPARPLVEPTWEEYKDVIRAEVREIFGLKKYKYRF